MKKIRVSCLSCRKEITTNNLSKHLGSKACSKKRISIDESWRQQNGKYRCPSCEKEYTKKGIGTHIWRAHTKEGQAFVENQTPYIGFSEGHRIIWNKGLTSDTDDRVKRIAKNLKDGYTSGRITPSMKGKNHTKEAKLKISEKLSRNNKGGRCKWYMVEGQKLQGTWEREVAKKLSSFGIIWRKLSLQRDSLKYIKQGKEHYYTPDLFLQEYNCFLEIKGYWWGDDKEKMRLVCEQHTTFSKQVVIIEKEQYDCLLYTTRKEDFLKILMAV